MYFCYSLIKTTYYDNSRFCFHTIDTKKISKLRNKIAHINDIINTEKSFNSDKPYNYNGLHEYILYAISFFNSYDHLEEALDKAINPAGVN